MLGLILGRNAGLTILEPPLMLARFFEVRPSLPASGARAAAGDAIPARAGLEVAEADLPVDAVSRSFNFGVFRDAVKCGVELEDSMTGVVNTEFVADGGSTKSSKGSASTLARG